MAVCQECQHFDAARDRCAKMRGCGCRRRIGYSDCECPEAKWPLPQTPAPPAAPAARPAAAELLGRTEILVKSFERHASLLRFVRSVRTCYPAVPIRVVDDSRQLSDAARDVQAIAGVAWHSMPYDSGLAAGRNLAVRQSEAEYVVICDDDYLFCPETDLAALLLPVAAGVLDLCGGLMQRPHSPPENWCGRLSFAGRHGRRAIVMTASPSPAEQVDGVSFHRADITYNFFAARRATLLAHPYDETFKITVEHLDSFLEWKRAGLRVGYTTDCICRHEPGGAVAGYKRLRRRAAWAELYRKWGVRKHRTIAPRKFPRP